MKLYYDRKSKNPTYFIQMGIRNGKKVTSKNIVRIGKHNDLLKITDDPLAYARQKVKEYNDNLENSKIEMSYAVDFSRKIINHGDDISRSLTSNVGYLYIKSIFDQLGISEFLDKILENRKVKFNALAVHLFLVSSRVLDPGSKLHSFGNIKNYYGDFDFDYQHIHRFMEILDPHFDEYIKYLFVQSNSIIKRNTSVCYFDCTNFYFEKEYEDEDDYDDVTGELIKGLIKYGISKEHRPNPIVQMGMFMDGDGIPLSMCINPGNQNESSCVIPAESELIKMFENKELVYCSDAGLGYTNTRVFNSMGNRKFIVTQSIKKLSDNYKKSVFNDFDYRLIQDDQPITLEFMKKFDKSKEENLNYYNGFAYKIIEVEKLVDLGLEKIVVQKNGKTRKVKDNSILKHRIIVTYSRKMAEYQKKVRQRQIDRAKNLLEKNKDLDKLKKNPNDYTRFIKRNSKEQVKYVIDQSVIDEEARYDGFYAIATNIYDKDVKEIMEINSRRYKIEDCFRVMKTNFNSRPVYHYKDSKIKSHFLICFTALLIYRLIEVKLDRNGTHFTTTQIIETLKNMNVSNVEDLYYKAEYTGSNCLSALEGIFNLELDKKNYLPKTLNKISKIK